MENPLRLSERRGSLISQSSKSPEPFITSLPSHVSSEDKASGIADAIQLLQDYHAVVHTSLIININCSRKDEGIWRKCATNQSAWSQG